MKPLTLLDIQQFLQRLGQVCTVPTAIHLLGGTALYLLGNLRTTGDIDYVGNNLPSQDDEFDLLIKRIANELDLDVEAVPIDGFLPVPQGTEQRHIFIGNYELLTVYVYDPYTIALSKVERGFASDFQDVQFLVTHEYVDLSLLEQQATILESKAIAYLIDVVTFRRHFETLKKLLKA